MWQNRGDTRRATLPREKPDIISGISIIFPEMPSITGHKLLVIGGSSGIGAAVAQLAVSAGVYVAIASSNPARVEAAVARIKQAVPQANIHGLICDVSRVQDVEAQLERVLTEASTVLGGGPLDHIVTTANRRPDMSLSLADLTAEWLQAASQMPVVVPALLAKLAPRFLKAAASSSVTVTTGRIADKPVRGAGVWSGYAAAVGGLVRGLAVEVAPIRFNAVCPGTTDTEMQGPPEVRGPRMAAVAQTSVLRKVGSAEEVGEAYVYLMKDSNSTGSTVNTDGGYLLQ